MDKHALVSIVIPTYKRAKALHQAISSVQKQTFKNWQLIVVDDNSVDSFERTATELAMKPYLEDPRIVYIQHDKNLGACKARNTGIEYADGEYIAFLDDDDLWLETKLERQIQQLEKDNTAVCYSDMYLEYQGRKKYYQCLSVVDLYKQLLNQGFGVCTSALVIRKDALIAINGFDDSLPSMQDYDLLLRLTHQYQSSYIPEPLLTYQLADDGISCNPISKLKGHLAIISKYESTYRDLNLHSGLARHYESAGDFYLRSDQRLNSLKLYIKAGREYRFKLRLMLKIFFGALFGAKPLESYLMRRQNKTSAEIS